MYTSWQQHKNWLYQLNKQAQNMGLNSIIVLEKYEIQDSLHQNTVHLIGCNDY